LRASLSCSALDFLKVFYNFFIMADHITLATNETSEEIMLSGRSKKPQVRRKSKLPVHFNKTGGLQRPQTSLKLPIHGGGECVRDQQTATQGLSNNQVSENRVHLNKPEDKENSEDTTTVKSENVQHRYRLVLCFIFVIN